VNMATNDELVKDLAGIKKWQREYGHMIAENRKRIIQLEEKTSGLNSETRKNYGALSHDLKHHIAEEIRSARNPNRVNMTYREVKAYLHLKHDVQAYNVMKTADKTFPEDLKYVKKGGTIRLVPTRKLIEEVR
jgi:hypothetical protein